MSPPRSSLFRVEDIPDAGRGVIASQALSKGTDLLRSDPPAAHVIFRQYRKEVCAQCFRYDLGRTLPVRHSSAAKVFCSAECRVQWLSKEGELGAIAWESVQAFVLATSQDATNSYESLPDRGAKPSAEEVESAWTRDTEHHIDKAAHGSKKSRKSNAKALVDPDVMGFLLSSVLEYHRDLDLWLEKVMALARDPEPYRSTHELSVYRESFNQLRTLLPEALQKSCKPEICNLAVAATSHNSFGIRSEDGEEYMGYALYPDASYFNHSCRPNVSKVRAGRQWIFSAERDIEPGEECCITYLGGDEKDLSVVERRARLQEHWGFECMCVRCREELP